MRAFAVLAAVSLAACSYTSDDSKPGIASSGSGNTRSFQVANFTKVSLRGSDDVDVRVGSSFSVRAEGDPDVLDYLKIEQDGDTLKISRRNRSGFNWGDKSAKIFITMPRIEEGAVAGSGDLTIDRAEGNAFSGNSAGSGDIAIGRLAVDHADFSMAGSGGVTAAGSAKSVKIDIAGSGDVDAKQLTASSAEVSVAGSGNVDLTVDGPAKVAIMGSGDVDLGSKARCETSKLGSGSVTCGG